MSCLNDCMFTGRLTTDPEVKSTVNGTSVCTVKIACERGYGENKTVVFPTLVAWRGVANFIGKLSKGTMIGVRCEMTQRTWTDSKNNKRYETEFLVKEVQALESKKEQSNNEFPDYSSSSDSFEDLSSDDQLPF